MQKRKNSNAIFKIFESHIHAIDDNRMYLQQTKYPKRDYFLDSFNKYLFDDGQDNLRNFASIKIIFFSENRIRI